MKLEEPRGENNYLAWSQKGNIFAAVDRFNIVTFWNSLTGKIIYRKALEGSARIQDASSYRCHDCQTRYQDSSNLFDSITQSIVSYRMHLKLADESRDQYRMKIVKLNLFEESSEVFDASCHTLSTFKLEENSIRNRANTKVSHIIQLCFLCILIVQDYTYKFLLIG